MPQFSVRAFASDPNQMRSGGDYIKRKKAETLYTTVSTNRKDHEQDNLAVLINSGREDTTSTYDMSRCLFAVGGFNVNSYDLYLNLTKGRFYTAPTGRGISIDPNISSSSHVAANFLIGPTDVTISDCSGTRITSSDPTPTQNTVIYSPLQRNGIGNIYDGTLLTNMNPMNDISGAYTCGCYTNTLMDLSNVGIDAGLFAPTAIPPNVITAGQHLARLALQEPLRDFAFPSKFNLPRPRQN